VPRKPIKDIFPVAEVLLNLEPEEIAIFLLDYLCEMEDGREYLSCYNFAGQCARDIESEDAECVNRVIIEAWEWLENEGMLASLGSGSGYFVTRRGRRLRKKADLEAYKKGNFLPKHNLDSVLLRDVYPIFIRGDYDIAVFAAYKAVEVRVREKANLPTILTGAELMRIAFHTDTGILTDKVVPIAERQAICNLFQGSIGSFRNPTSHREVDFNDPSEVAEIILFANYLLRVIGRRAN
jgi:uncharacterized protein (TIGR02391 family)